MFRKFLPAAVLALACAGAHAERTPGLSMTAFNAAVPESARNAVFAPFAFELDAAIVSEAFPTIERAKFVETLGALTGYDTIYFPRLVRLREAATNDFQLISGRAFLAPSRRIVETKFRTKIQEEYDAETCVVYPDAYAAECFLKVAMDGEMEDFKLPEEYISDHSVSFADLETVKVAWTEPFPLAATKPLAFTAGDGRRLELPAMHDVREGELRTTDRFTLLRLPLADDAWFCAAMPAGGANLASIRDEFAGGRLDENLALMKSIVEPTVYRGPVEVAIPKFAVETTVPLAPVFLALQLPLGGFREIHLREAETLAAPFQRVKFALDERGIDETYVKEKPAEKTFAAGTAKKCALDRPFLFFVYHEPTAAVVIAGVFTGEGK